MKNKKASYRHVKTNLIKAKVILVLKNGVVLHGDGTFEGVKSADNTAFITAHFTHPLASKKKKK